MVDAKNFNCSILVAEDDAEDQFLLKKAMAENGMKNEVNFVKDGQELIDHLTDRLKSPTPNLPCLVLLDLNMPRMDGRETLRLMKGEETLKKIPVVILTTSNNQEDIQSSYSVGANSFFTKPLNFKDLIALVGLLNTYWMQRAELPFGLS